MTDIEAFEKWWEENIDNYDIRTDTSRAWEAACDYKQKDIDDLIKQSKHEHDLYKKHLKIYEDENAKLRECVEFYADLNDEVSMYDSRGVTEARQVLKELNNEGESK